MEWLGRIETAALTALSLGVLVARDSSRWRAAPAAPARRRLAPVVFAGVVLALGFTGGFLLQTLAADERPDGRGGAAGHRPRDPAHRRRRRACSSACCAMTATRGRASPTSSSRLDGLPSTGVLQDVAARRLGGPVRGGLPLGSPARRPGAMRPGGRAAPPTGRRRARGRDDRATVRRRRLAIALDPVLRDDPGLVAAAVAAVRLAVENERLQAEVRAQLEDVQASRARIVEAQDTERRRLERDLHDGAQQRLVSLQLSLELLRRQLGPGRRSGDPRRAGCGHQRGARGGDRDPRAGPRRASGRPDGGWPGAGPRVAGGTGLHAGRRRGR